MTRIPHTSLPRYPKGVSSARLASQVQTKNPTGCKVAILGLADDLGVRLNQGRPGAKHGPRAFREALAKYGVADPFGWAWPPIFDAGDVIPVKGDGPATLAKTHDRVSDAVHAILDLGMLPIGIGGGHDLTLPFVRAVIDWHNVHTPRTTRKPPQRFRGIYFDAHLDVRDTPGSGMAFRELIEEHAVESLTVHGLNPFANARQHVEWFLDNGGRFGEEDAVGGAFTSAPTFVSFDMDVLDASCAPGVSALNPAGWSVGLAEAWLDELGADRNVKCFDLMEFNPVHDADGRTARAAVHLFLSFLHGFTRRATKPTLKGKR